MYIEVSPLNLNKGDFARLLSPRYPATQGSCLQFWYHMYGRAIGTLNVYLRSRSWSMSKVWSKTGNDTNIWNVAQVSVSSRYSYQVCLCFTDRKMYCQVSSIKPFLLVQQNVPSSALSPTSFIINSLVLSSSLEITWKKKTCLVSNA